jgi:hypothetical protein
MKRYRYFYAKNFESSKRLYRFKTAESFSDEAIQLLLRTRNNTSGCGKKKKLSTVVHIIVCDNVEHPTVKLYVREN